MYYVSLPKAKQTSQDLLDKTYKEMKDFIRDHKREFSHVHLTKPKLVWRACGLGCAGRCYLGWDLIELNTNYLSSRNARKFIRSTLLHELAHDLAWKIFKDTGHGKGWKLIDKFIGDDGSIYCNYDPPTENKVERRKYHYEY